MGIRGNFFEDFMVSCCHHRQSLCQQMNELKRRTECPGERNYGIRAGVKYDVEAIKAAIARGDNGQQPHASLQQHVTNPKAMSIESPLAAQI